jgi:hypothetical protein
MFNDIKWMFMVDWLNNDAEARAEKTAEVVANALAGGVFTSTEYKTKR